MAPRVTASEVTTNFETSLSPTEIDGWISTATLLVDDVESADSSVSADRLKEIELALTRHFAHAQDPRVESSGVGDSTVTYQGDTGMHLEATHYGQQAKMLDPTGTLENAHKESASIHVPDSRGID